MGVEDGRQTWIKYIWQDEIWWSRLGENNAGYSYSQSFFHTSNSECDISYDALD